jgi:hypothetical protein
MTPPPQRWAATEAVDPIGRIVIATTYGTGHRQATITPALRADALPLPAPARGGIDRLETQLIMVARQQGLPRRFIADALGS